MKTLTNNSKFKYLLFFFAAGVTTFTSCKTNSADEPAPTTATATISITNALEGSTAQDFYLGDTKVNASALAYGQSTGYLTYNAGDRSAKFTNTGTTTANVQFNVTLQTNQSYSVFYTGGATASSSSYLFLSDGDISNTTDKARVRFVNLANNLAAGVDFGISATSKVVSGLAYKTASAYQSIDANSQLTLYAAGSVTALLSIPTTVRPGKTYTVYVSGNSATTLSYHVISQN